MHSAGGGSSFCFLLLGSITVKKNLLILQNISEIFCIYLKIESKILTVLDSYHHNLKVKPIRMNVEELLPQLLIVETNDIVCGWLFMYLWRSEFSLKTNWRPAIDYARDREHLHPFSIGY